MYYFHLGIIKNVWFFKNNFDYLILNLVMGREFHWTCITDLPWLQLYLFYYFSPSYPCLCFSFILYEIWCLISLLHSSVNILLFCLNILKSFPFPLIVTYLHFEIKVQIYIFKQVCFWLFKMNTESSFLNYDLNDKQLDVSI